MQGTVEYTLAKRAVLREFRAGRLSQRDICDAHPDLLRAANYCGEPAEQDCPVCGRTELVLVSYAFSEDFPKEDRQTGRVWSRQDLAGLLRLRHPRLYTVEVCTECSWNHLRSQLALSGGGRRGREASR